MNDARRESKTVPSFSHATQTRHTHHSCLAGAAAAQPPPEPVAFGVLTSSSTPFGPVTFDSGYTLPGPSDPDLSRGPGDYTPRDKHMLWAPKVVRIDAHLEQTNVLVVSIDTGDSFQSQKWTVFLTPVLHGSWLVP